MGLKVKGCPKVLPEHAPWRYRSLGRPRRQGPVSGDGPLREVIHFGLKNSPRAVVRFDGLGRLRGSGPLREQTPALRANYNLEGNFDKNVAGFRRIIRQCYPRHGNTPRATPEGQLVPSGSSPGATRCRATSLQKTSHMGSPALIRWRRRRDSNPRTGSTRKRFSRPPHSTTLPLLRIE